MKELIVIGGPTASGKTSLAIETALELKTEIISADSRQFYKEMSIGTAKPTAEELSRVQHHFINSSSITEEYSAGQFEQEALAQLHKLFETNDHVVCVGGSGLYIKALTEGFDALPKQSKAIREQLNEQVNTAGLAALQEELKQKDPEYAQSVDLANPQRVIRALEIIRGTGKKYSDLRKNQKKKRAFTTTYYAIDWPRELLYERINQRVDNMMEEGLLEEVKSLYNVRHNNALNTVGYKELFDYLAGHHSLDDAIALIKRNTRRYAKRQLTWFRRIPEINYLPPGGSLTV